MQTDLRVENGALAEAAQPAAAADEAVERQTVSLHQSSRPVVDIRSASEQMRRIHMSIALRSISAALMVLFVVQACTSGTSERDTSADVEAIRAAVNRATEINNAGDAAAWADLFAEGAIVMPAGEREITTRQDLEAYAQRWFDRFNTDITINPVEIEVLGDWAFVRTRVTGTSNSKDEGDPVRVDDKEIAIFRRQSDGAWKVWRLIGNSN